MFEKLKTIIADQLGIDPDEIEENTKIAEDLGADSLDVVEMLLAMEEELGITIPSDDIEELETVGDVVGYIESNCMM